METTKKPVLTFSRAFIFFINVFVNGFVLFALLYLILSIFVSKYVGLYAVLLSIGIMALLIGLAFTSAGENILRFSLRLRKPTHEEMEILREPWNKVLAASGIQKEDIRPELFVQDNKYPNAFACSTRTIAVTRGLLKFTPEEIEGTLAHEMGHIVHGDTKISLIVTTVNTIGNIASAILLAVLAVFSVFTQSFGHVARGDVGIFSFIFGVAVGALALLFKGLLWIVQKLVSIGYFAIGRQEEFEADRYAKELGFGAGLVSTLRKLEDLDESPTGFWNAVESSHPPIPVRIDKILYG